MREPKTRRACERTGHESTLCRCLTAGGRPKACRREAREAGELGATQLTLFAPRAACERKPKEERTAPAAPVFAPSPTPPDAEEVAEAARLAAWQRTQVPTAESHEPGWDGEARGAFMVMRLAEAPFRVRWTPAEASRDQTEYQQARGFRLHKTLADARETFLLLAENDRALVVELEEWENPPGRFRRLARLVEGDIQQNEGLAVFGEALHAALRIRRGLAFRLLRTVKEKGAGTVVKESQHATFEAAKAARENREPGTISTVIEQRRWVQDHYRNAAQWYQRERTDDARDAQKAKAHAMEEARQQAQREAIAQRSGEPVAPRPGDFIEREDDPDHPDSWKPRLRDPSTIPEDAAALPRIYEVPAENLPTLREKLAKIAKRVARIAARGGRAFEPPKLTVLGSFKRPDRERVGVVHLIHRVEITGEPATLGGWEFLAGVSHQDAMNIVRAPAWLKLKDGFLAAYRHAAPKCEHCNLARRRNDTFLLRNLESGQIKQIGRSCLQDFLKVSSADEAAAWAEYSELVATLSDVGEASEGGGGGSITYVDLSDYLKFVAGCIRLFGWVSRTQARDRDDLHATADEALSAMFPPKSRDLSPKEKEAASPTAEDRARAEEAIKGMSDTLGAKPEADLTDYEANILAILLSTAVNVRRDTGLAASIITAWDRARGVQRERAEKAAKAPSAYFGTVGEKWEGRLRFERSFTSEGNYGTTWILRFSEGPTFSNEGVWFSSNNPSDLFLDADGRSGALVEGQVYKAFCSVKKHDVRRGTQQTILTRCTIRPDGWIPPVKKRKTKKERDAEKAAEAAAEAERIAKLEQEQREAQAAWEAREAEYARFAASPEGIAARAASEEAGRAVAQARAQADEARANLERGIRERREARARARETLDGTDAEDDPALAAVEQRSLFQNLPTRVQEASADSTEYAQREEWRRDSVLMQAELQERDVAAGEPPWPFPDDENHFLSGSNGPNDILGVLDGGNNPGVAVQELSRLGIDTLVGEAWRPMARVFADSGAFSEVAPVENPGPHRFLKIAQPITEAEWDRRLGIYEQIAAAWKGRLWFVAPDCVGSQSLTLQRLARWRERVLAIRNRWGAHPIVAIQGEAQSGEPGMGRREFDRRVQAILGDSLYVRGLPMRRGATTPPEVLDFALYLGSGGDGNGGFARVHLLGLGPEGAAFPEVATMLRAYGPFLSFTSDSVVVRSTEWTRRGGKKLGKLTAAQDALRAEGVGKGPLKDSGQVKRRGLERVLRTRHAERTAEAKAGGWYDPELGPDEDDE